MTIIVQVEEKEPLRKVYKTEDPGNTRGDRGLAMEFKISEWNVKAHNDLGRHC